MQQNLTPERRKRAYDALRGTSIRATPWEDLVADRRWHVNEASRCAAALEAYDLHESNKEQLRGGMDWHLQLIAEIDDEGRHRKQAEAFGYQDQPCSGAIAPERWAAARLIDCGLVMRALTGQEGRQSGDLRYFNCPWHRDKTPSLVTYPPGRGFHCFGCGAAGDAVQMVARTHGITAGEALALLESGALFLPFEAFTCVPAAGQVSR